MFNIFNYRNLGANSSNESNMSIGGKELINTESNSIKHCGPINVKHSKILESMEIIGPAEIEYSNINNLSVSGLVKITNSLIEGSCLKIAGAIVIMHSQVNCQATFGSNRVEIISSTLQGIEVNNSNHNIKEIINLNNTIINGDIVFTSENGEVNAYASKCNGRIIGGRLIEHAEHPEPTI